MSNEGQLKWVIQSAPFKKNIGKTSKTFVTCQCECGTVRDVLLTKINTGRSNSCGCVNRKFLEKRTKHGKAKTRLYNIWCKMKTRCLCPTGDNYHHYGGRGISVCKEWETSFVAFESWAKANGYKHSLSIDRIDVNGNYEPNNCRWATQKEQVSNRRNTIVVHEGKNRMSLKDACIKQGLDYKIARICIRKKGWDFSDLTSGKRPTNKKQVICLETNNFYKSLDAVIQQYGGSKSQLSQVLHGKRKTFAGLHWEFKHR